MQISFVCVTVYVWTRIERPWGGTYLPLSGLSGGRLRRLGPTEEILLLTSSSFITSYSNGIFLCVQTHPPAPLLTLQTVWQPGWVCVCVWLCCVCEFVWAISQLCVRVWICVDVCALSSPLTTHMHTKAFLFQKCITVSFSEDVTGQV